MSWSRVHMQLLHKLSEFDQNKLEKSSTALLVSPDDPAYALQQKLFPGGCNQLTSKVSVAVGQRIEVGLEMQRSMY